MPAELRGNHPTHLEATEDTLRRSAAVRYNALAVPGGDLAAWHEVVDFFHRAFAIGAIRLNPHPDWQVTRSEESEVEQSMGLRPMTDLIRDFVALLEEQRGRPFTPEDPFIFLEAGPGSGDFLYRLTTELTTMTLDDGRRLSDIILVRGLGDTVYSSVARVLTGFTGPSVDTMNSGGWDDARIKRETKTARDAMRPVWGFLMRMMQHRWHQLRTTAPDGFEEHPLHRLFEENDPYALRDVLLNPSQWLDEAWLSRHPTSDQIPFDGEEETAVDIRRILRKYFENPTAFLERHAPDLLRHGSADDAIGRDRMARSLLVHASRIIPGRFETMDQLLPTAGVHLILSRRAFSHSHNLPDNLHRAARLLAPGGMLLDDSVHYHSRTGNPMKPEVARFGEAHSGWDVAVVRREQPEPFRDRCLVARRPPLCSAAQLRAVVTRPDHELVGLMESFRDPLSAVTIVVQRAVEKLLSMVDPLRRREAQHVVLSVARDLQNELPMASAEGILRNPGRLVVRPLRPSTGAVQLNPLEKIQAEGRERVLQRLRELGMLPTDTNAESTPAAPAIEAVTMSA